MKTKLLLICLLLGTTLGYAQFKESQFQINGMTLPYLVSYPDDFDENKEYPLLVFLHGAGERGDDNQAQLRHGKDFLVSNTKKDFPAIVIAPQCPSSSYWSNMMSNNINNKRVITFGRTETPTIAMELLTFLIEDWINSGLVDTKQVYVGGLSMGGMGTFELLWRMPNTFAAAFPICGGGDASKVDVYAQTTPLWIFHGGDDNVVDPKHSSTMYEALKTAGCDVKYTEYPGVNHGSWNNAFQEKYLFSWLFSHKK